MFRTDFNHWLQSFESDFMTFFMKSVSFLGLTYPIMLAGLVVISVYHFRKGLILLNIISIAAALTVALKISIDYPRPIAVDPYLIQFDEKKTNHDFSHLQPEGNMDLFSLDLLQEIRQKEIGRYGLPSGHTSIQTALWIGLVFLFRKKWLLFLSIIVIGSTLLSRMYLGVHYPGDIVGGLILGLFVVFVILVLANQVYVSDEKKVNWQQLFFYLFPLPLYFFMPKGEGWQLAIIIGINLAIFFSFFKKKLPEINPNTVYQILNFTVITFLFLGFFFVARFLSGESAHWIKFLLNLLVGYGSVRIWLLISLKFQWLKIGSIN